MHSLLLFLAMLFIPVSLFFEIRMLNEQYAPRHIASWHTLFEAIFLSITILSVVFNEINCMQMIRISVFFIVWVISEIEYVNTMNRRKRNGR